MRCYLSLALIFALPCAAITLSSISVSDQGANFCRVVGSVSPDAYVQIYYGTSSGTYPYNTYIYLTGQRTNDSGSFALVIGGVQGGPLQSATTYHFQVRAQPNPNNMTGQVVSGDLTCTTTTASTTPTPPTVYAPPYPTVSGSGYTIIPMVVSGGGYVVAPGGVTHTGGVFCASDPTWTVAGGDTIDQIMTVLVNAGSGAGGWGAVIEWPQGTTGPVPDTNTYNGGYLIPSIGVDVCSTGIADPNHRWNIFRTHQINASDFPPYGARINPEFAPILGNLQAQIPTYQTAASGQVFTLSLQNSSTIGIHHFWFSNMELSVNTASSGTSTTTQTVGTGVFTFTTQAGLSFQNGQFVVISCTATPADYLAANIASYSGTTLTTTSVTNFGGSGSCSNWTIAGLFGSYFFLSSTGGNAYDAAVPCSYIVLDRIYFATPAPPYYTYGGIFGGVGQNVRMVGNYVVGFQQPGGGGENTSSGITIEDCSIGPLTIFNNEVSAAGQGIYIESLSQNPCGSGGTARPGAQIVNLTENMNAVYNPCNWLQPANSGSTFACWDGIARPRFREPFEHKNGQYVQTKGDWINGSFGGQTSGNANLIFNQWNPEQTTGATGIHDVEFSFNYIVNAVSFMDVYAACGLDTSCGVGPDPQPVYNLSVHDNLAVNLGRYNYAAVTIPGAYDSYFNHYNGAQGFHIYHNSLGLINADQGSPGATTIPAILATWDGGIFSNQFAMTGNLMWFSKGATGAGESGIIALQNVCLTGCATFPVAPQPTFTNYTTQLQTTMVNVAGSVTYSGTWGGNVFVCGQDLSSGVSPVYDLTDANCETITTSMPTGDLYPVASPLCTIATFGCTAARNTAGGYKNVANGDLTCTPSAGSWGNNSCYAGANIQGLIAALGITKNIVVQVGPTAVQASFTSPDTNACSVDIWQGSGSRTSATVTRGTYSGSTQRAQSVTIGGLTAGTLYSGEIWCRYQQNRPWFSFPAEPSNMATEFTFTTTATGTRSVSLIYTPISGETSRVVTVTPVNQSSLGPITCSSSPCSVSSVPFGAFTAQIQHKNSGGNVFLTETIPGN